MLKVIRPECTGANGLTNYCLLILTSVVWTFHTFESNFGICHKFTYYLKETFELGFDQHFSFKYYVKIALVREISPKLSGVFGATGMNVLTH